MVAVKHDGSSAVTDGDEHGFCGKEDKAGRARARQGGRGRGQVATGQNDESGWAMRPWMGDGYGDAAVTGQETARSNGAENRRW